MSRLTFPALLSLALPLLADSVKCPTANIVVVATTHVVGPASTFCLACEEIVVTVSGGSVCTSSNAQAVTTTLKPLSTSTFDLGPVYPESILSGPVKHTISSPGPKASTSGGVTTAYEAPGPGVITAVSSTYASGVAAAAHADASVSGASTTLSEATGSGTAPDMLGAAVTASTNPYYYPNGGSPPIQGVSSATVGGASSSASSSISNGGGTLPAPMQSSTTTASGPTKTSTGSVHGQSTLSGTTASSSLAVYTGGSSKRKAAVWSIGLVLGAMACWI
ncbi:hypothetical protein BDV97DRAFT_348076 [Delphinella strobiligena]|nr:hypothetical protein BDV97DRAFT_348076 [Delphinella strobiligena]